MPNHWDTVFSPSLYLDRDKEAFKFINSLLGKQASCASVCIYGNGKDYMFTNVVKEFEGKKLSHKLKVLNTVSADELKDFTDMLVSEPEPTLCLVNLRIGKDVSWFIKTLDELRVKRGYGFVSYVNAYIGDIYEALQNTSNSVMQPLVILGRIDYEDSLHMIQELADRFEFYPTEDQKKDIYKWSYGHIGLIRTLFLLKSQSPKKLFTAEELLGEPTILERLNNIIGSLPPGKIEAIQNRQLSFIEKALLEKFGFIDAEGDLFHPLLLPLIPKKVSAQQTALSNTEKRVLGYLREHQGIAVSRGDVAKIIWGEEEWEDKYSDWAIGQLIYRLRKKLAYSASSANIRTLKGQGFVYAIRK